MKILIDDGKQICKGTGIGKYTLSLYNALLELGEDVDLVEQGPFKKVRSLDRLKYLYYINSDRFIEKSSIYDVVLFTNYDTPCKKNSNVKYVTTIADMASYLYPETLPLLYRYYNRLMIRNTLKNADLVFTVSDSIRREILTEFPVYKNKLVYTWLGVNDGIGPLNEYPKYKNKELENIEKYPYFLFVSTVEKRKNVGMVLKAFFMLKKHNPKAACVKLVIAGRPGLGYDNFLNQVNASPYKDDVIFTGYISDEDCNRLYNHALAFVFPTVYEGFGFANIECMKCHLPIILSDIAVNKEISRDYGEFFDLNNEYSLVAKMEMFIEGKYDYATKNKLADEYLEDFQWNNIAKQYVDYMYKLVKG